MTWLRVSAEAQQPSEINTPAEQQDAQERAADHPAIQRGRIVGIVPHHQEAAQQRQPHQDIKQQRRGELGRHHLEIAHRRGHQRLERAGEFLQRKQPHRDHRRRQQQDQPEERRDVKQLRHRHGRRLLLQLDAG